MADVTTREGRNAIRTRYWLSDADMFLAESDGIRVIDIVNLLDAADQRDRYREALEKIVAEHDGQECCGSGVPDGRGDQECCGRPTDGLERAQTTARTALTPPGESDV